MKILKISLALLLCAAFVLGCMPMTATAAVKKVSYVKGANDVSESYKNSVYYERLTNVVLTGDGRHDVLAVALSQLGYQESGTENDFDGKPSGSGSNYTEYNYNMGNFGVGYGGGSYAWCASFVSWCLLQSGCTDQSKMSDWCRSHKNDKNYIWREVGCPTWANSLRTHGYWEYSKHFGNDYIPVGGDLIFFTWDGKQFSEDHIGIVVFCDGSTVYTIEGNTADAAGLQTDGGGVYFKSYPIGSSYISGYGVMPYKKTNDDKVDLSGKTRTGGWYIADRATAVYANADFTRNRVTMPRYTTFTVLRLVDGGMRIAYTTAKGTRVEGYIKDVKTAFLPINYGELLSRGDLNDDNKVDSFDYIRIKRSLLNTYKLSDDETVIADINDDLVVNSFDYILVKRHVLKTYTIKD